MSRAGGQRAKLGGNKKKGKGKTIARVRNAVYTEGGTGGGGIREECRMVGATKERQTDTSLAGLGVRDRGGSDGRGTAFARNNCCVCLV